MIKFIKYISCKYHKLMFCICFSILCTGCKTDFFLYSPGPFTGSVGSVVYYPQERKSFDVFNIRLPNDNLLTDQELLDLLAVIKEKINNNKEYVLLTSSNVNNNWKVSHGYLVKVNMVKTGTIKGIKDISVINKPSEYDKITMDWNYNVPGEFRKIIYDNFDKRAAIPYKIMDDSKDMLKLLGRDIISKFGDPHCIILKSDGKWLCYKSISNNKLGVLCFCIGENEKVLTSRVVFGD